VDHNGTSWHAPRNLDIHARVLGVPLWLQVSCSRTARDNLHALFALITGLVIVVDNNDLAPRLLRLVALFAGLISPLLKLREGDMFDVLSSFRPRASPKQFVVIGVYVTDMGDDGELHATRQ
jgi:hypothetical protein